MLSGGLCRGTADSTSEFDDYEARGNTVGRGHDWTALAMGPTNPSYPSVGPINAHGRDTQFS